MSALGRSVLDSRAAFRRSVIKVPEWGGDVHIRELSAAEVARVQQIATGAIDMESKQVRDVEALARFQSEVVIAGWVDETGDNVLTAKDADKLMAQPSQIIANLAKEITKLSGMEAPDGDLLESAKND